MVRRRRHHCRYDEFGYDIADQRGPSALAFGCSAPASACCGSGEFLCHGDRSKGGNHICPQGEWRKVLIVGRGGPARKTVEAIRSDSGSKRSVVKVLSNNQFAEICAAGQFSTFAREEFIDEIVIASREADFANVVNEAL